MLTVVTHSYFRSFVNDDKDCGLFWLQEEEALDPKAISDGCSTVVLKVAGMGFSMRWLSLGGVRYIASLRC